MTLDIDRVTKRFGQTLALDELTFSVPKGRIFGFLGANGAGKTTTMRICLGILQPDDGEVRWEGTRSGTCHAGRSATCPRSAVCIRA